MEDKLNAYRDIQVKEENMGQLKDKKKKKERHENLKYQWLMKIFFSPLMLCLLFL